MNVKRIFSRIPTSVISIFVILIVLISYILGFDGIITSILSWIFYLGFITFIFNSICKLFISLKLGRFKYVVPIF